MLDTFGAIFKAALGRDISFGLIGLFVFLHFYYGIPVHGLEMASVGFAAVFTSAVFLSVISYFLGNRCRSVVMLISAAVALDLFYSGQFGCVSRNVVFDYLWNGPAVVNFASFGLVSVFIFSQIDL